MELMWLYSLCQCILSVSIIVASVRLCVALSGVGAVGPAHQGSRGDGPKPGSISKCLSLCLGWVGAIGGAVEVPATVFLNLRIPQCLYTCVTMVCFPLLVRQFTMFLLMLLTVDSHLLHHLADRYSLVVTRRRALCVVLLCWVCSVLSSFAEFIGSDVLHTWSGGAPDTAGLGLDGNWSTSLPHPNGPPPPKYDRKVIGKYLPYGGFLSKFYVEDMHNFTYAQIHSSHWAVCAPDTILSPHFLVYVHGTMVFVLPFLCLLVVYLDLLCMKASFAETPKQDSRRVRSLALSLSLLVLLCLPVHIIHGLLLFAPSINLPAWAHAAAAFLFQLYGLVPQFLFTPARSGLGEAQATFPPSLPSLPPTVAHGSRRISVQKVLCEAMQAAPWFSAKHSLKAKVCPEV